jgi:oxalate decarboxylase/phosphoglucose isomerase-like protein (cupin superfamily)
MDTITVGSDELTFRATGDVLAVDVRLPPGGGPPFLHRHAPTEIYRVDAGELAVYLEDGGEVRRVAAGAGDVVPIAGGRAHTVRNESGAEVHAYVVFSPGAEMEAFVRAAAEAPAEVMALAERHGIDVTNLTV